MMSISLGGSNVPSATIVMKSDSFCKKEGISPQIIIAHPDRKTKEDARGAVRGAIITEKDDTNDSGPPEHNEARLRELLLLSMGKQLLDSCKVGDAAKVKQLMLDGAPFIADWVGTSPLHYSVMNRHVEVTELLLKAGIFRDAKNKVDRTPLHVAAHMGLSYMVKLLLAYGANVNCKDMLSMTPLHWAAENGDLLTTKILLDYGADTSVRNKFDKTAHMIATRKNFYEVTNEIEEIGRVHPEIRMTKVSQLRLRTLGSNKAMKPVAEILEPSFSSVSADSAYNLLKSHGVAMMEPDKDTVVSSAVLNGHTIRLTDAGMLAFKSLERNLKIDRLSDHHLEKDSSPESDDLSRNAFSVSSDGLLEPPVKMSRLSNGAVLRKVNAQDLINMKKDNKIIITGASVATASPLPECTIDLPGGNSRNNEINLPDQCTPEGLAERNALYLQRLENKASECQRQVEVLRNQCMIKEQEYERLRKQIELFKKCSLLK